MKTNQAGTDKAVRIICQQLAVSAVPASVDNEVCERLILKKTNTARFNKNKIVKVLIILISKIDSIIFTRIKVLMLRSR